MPVDALSVNEMKLLKQRLFLQNRSISMVDMYIDNSDPSENVGQIHFSLEYDFQNTTLILKIIQVSILVPFFLSPHTLLLTSCHNKMFIQGIYI